MMEVMRIFKAGQPTRRTSAAGDAAIILAVGVVLYIGVRLAFFAPAVLKGPDISLEPSVLPWYAVLSVGRMFAAYLLSLVFGLVYGHVAAYNRSAERILMPVLDILQSIPILSFLPVVVLSLTVVLPQGVALELASIVLIFTSQAWNMTFAWFQSLTTIPNELREASAIFRLNGWLRFKTLELPFGMISLVWNSVMSWAGGWFFLMAAESFTVGQRDFRLPGLGSYLREAADRGDTQALVWGVIALLVVIVALDQLVWRPLLAWSERFKLESVEGEGAPSSWVYETVRSARLTAWLTRTVFTPASAALDATILRRFPATGQWAPARRNHAWVTRFAAVALAVVMVYGGLQVVGVLVQVPLAEWRGVAWGLVATPLRVALSLSIAFVWTIPVGVAIGTNPRLAAWLQPLVQIAASVPATALFPILLLGLVNVAGGLNVAAVLLMLLGTQWYLLFNIIAGASAIPQDLKYTTALLRLGWVERWRTLLLPALFPYMITGAITAGGGAWNASIVAEYVTFGGRTLSTVGIGSQIAHATATGNYPLLLAATLAMIVAVVSINRIFWRRLYVLAEERYRME